MALLNTFKFQETLVKGNDFLKNTHNDYLFISSRPYVDRKGKLPSGFVATVQVLHDDTDYGVDAKTGQPRENNVLQTFDITVLDGTDGSQFKKGEHVKVHGFRTDASFAIGFDLIFRVDGMEKIRNDK